MNWPDLRDKRRHRSPNPTGLTPVEHLLPAFLQGLIGTEVRVSLNLYGAFIGAGFQGELGFVQSLPPDADAIQIVLRGGHGLFLDPAEVEATLVRGPGGIELLEFHSKAGVTVTVEPLDNGT